MLPERPAAGPPPRLLLRSLLAARILPPRPGPPPAAPPGPAGRLLLFEEGSGPEALPEDLFGPGLPHAPPGPGPEAALALRPPPGPPLVFWDLETCGLADDPIFLLGVLRPAAEGPRLSLALARDPSGEPALLRRAGELLGPEAVWVTFNGRSFDAPRLLRRAALHGVELPRPLEHRDLLLAVRRRFRPELPDCRLSTVERQLLGLCRGAGEVPGREVPERYRDFVRTGEMRWIEPVLLHNRRDLWAMAALYVRLAAGQP